MSSFVGTGALVRLALRRDRIILAAFIVILVVMVAASADATVKLYPTAASRGEIAATINSATATLAMYGPIHDDTSIGALATFKTGMMGAIAVAVLALLIVIRHTRTEEETGRLELLGATVVGRQAPLTAALLVAGGAGIVSGVGTAVGLIAVGLPIAGSIVMGLGFACLGIVFAAVAGVTAQLARSARPAAGMAGAALGVAYLVRAIGDASTTNGLGWISWLSPIGWWQQSRPFAGNMWWVLALMLAVAVAVSALAYVLAARRDFAAGFLPDRPGPATASARLRSPLALAWRLQRGSLFTWAATFATVGVVVGGLVSSVGNFANNPQARNFIIKLGGEHILTDAYLALELGIAGILAAVFGVRSVMRLRAEESSLLAEPVLATAVGRVRWAWSHLTVALAGSALLLVVVGISAGVVSALQLSDAGLGARVVVGALVQIPAAWSVVGIVVAAFGLVPRAIVIGWVALLAFVLLGEFGPLFNLSQTVMNISPFAHVPRIPGGTFTLVPMLWLTAIAAGLIVMGLGGFRRRDVG